MPEAIKFTEEQKAAYRAEFAPKATDSQWSIFIEECQRRNLIPGTHVIFSLRSNSEYDATLQDFVKTNKVAFMTTINALRLIAKRDGNYRGRKEFKFHYKNAENNLYTTDIPEGTIPHAVSCEFLHKDWSKPLRVVARFDAYVQKTRKGDPTAMWAKRGEEQLAKCCEAQGLREIAPEEAGGLYIKEELEGDEAIDSGHSNRENRGATAAPQPIVAPQVNQNPAPEAPGCKFHSAPEPSTVSGVSNPVHSTFEATAPEPLKEEPKPEPVKPTDAQYAEAVDKLGPDMAKDAGTEPDRLPNANEFAMFGARATKLMRETLPKAGIKNGAAALQAYMVAGTGEKNTKKYTKNQWEKLLSALETATQEAIAKLVKGK